MIKLITLRKCNEKISLNQVLFPHLNLEKPKISLRSSWIRRREKVKVSKESKEERKLKKLNMLQENVREKSTRVMYKNDYVKMHNADKN